jgi:glycerol-3-phosphate acyltransferase PlsX
VVRVAVDTVRAGGPAPEVVHGAVAALADDPGLRVALVGPAGALTELLEGAGVAVPGERLEVVDAPHVVGPEDDPVVAVRGRRRASVRVAVELATAGEADAVVSAGPVAATTVAARFHLRRLPGLRTPALAVECVVGPTAVPVVGPDAVSVVGPDAISAVDAGAVTIVDAGAEPDATPGALVRYGELGADLVRRRGGSAPRVAALTPFGTSSRAVGELVALFDAAELGDGRFVGARSVDDALGGDVDVLVTGGAAGRLLVDTVRLLRPGGPANGVLVGVDGTVATLAPAPAEAVSRAIADVARLAADRRPVGRA